MKHLDISAKDIGFCIATALDLVSPVLSDHHKKVSSLAISIAAKIGMKQDNLDRICLTGLLHDAGALKLHERQKIEEFHVPASFVYKHCELGYRLFGTFKPFTDIANIIRFHHTWWDNGKGTKSMGMEVPLESHIIHLADRIAVLTKNKQNVMMEMSSIIERINGQRGKMFKPELVDAFNDLSSKTSFWLNAVSLSTRDYLFYRKKMMTLQLDEEGLLDLARLFGHIIDFRSRFTATHSTGVSATSTVLAGLANFSPLEVNQMTLAGYFHDLGKLAVSAEILEKPDKLSDQEFNIMKTHTYYSYHLIEMIPQLSILSEWAAFHHERLDGRGYPFQIKGRVLTLGSRIMAVADVFTAITEDRPYREGMSSEKAVEIVQKLSKEGKLDKNVAVLLADNHKNINSIRRSSESLAFQRYRQVTQLPKAA